MSIGTFDLNFEKQLIKDDAKETYDYLIARATRRQLEVNFVFEEFMKQFNKLVKNGDIL